MGLPQEKKLPEAEEAPSHPPGRRSRGGEAAARAVAGEDDAENQAAVAEASVLLHSEEAETVLSFYGEGLRRSRSDSGDFPAEDLDGDLLRRSGVGRLVLHLSIRRRRCRSWPALVNC